MRKTDYRLLGWAAYGLASLLIVIPLVDSVMGVWPLRVGQVNWRFGAVGLYSRAIVTQLLGVGLAVLTAVLLQHRLATRVFAVLSLAGAGMASLVVFLFLLDALQTRAQVRPEITVAFDLASVIALFKFVAGIGVAVLLGIGGWNASRRSRAELEAEERKKPHARLVVPPGSAQSEKTPESAGGVD